MNEKTIVETAIDVEANINDNSIRKTIKDGYGPTQSHNGKKIDRIIVSQYTEDNPTSSYAVTYSKGDNSIRGWIVNIGKNRQQQLDVYNDKLGRYDDIELCKLYKNILLFSYYDDSHRKYSKQYIKTKKKKIFFSN